MFHERTKLINVRYHYIQGFISQDDIKVCKIISTHDNCADIMSKSVPATKFIRPLLKLNWCYNLVHELN